MRLDKIFSLLHDFGLGEKDDSVQVGFGVYHLKESDSPKWSWLITLSKSTRPKGTASPKDLIAI